MRTTKPVHLYPKAKATRLKNSTPPAPRNKHFVPRACASNDTMSLKQDGEDSYTAAPFDFLLNQGMGVKFFALRRVQSYWQKTANLGTVTSLHRMLPETNGTKVPRMDRCTIRSWDLFGRAAPPFRPVKSVGGTHRSFCGPLCRPQMAR